LFECQVFQTKEKERKEREKSKGVKKEQWNDLTYLTDNGNHS
jgi:hypothetical protein